MNVAFAQASTQQARYWRTVWWRKKKMHTLDFVYAYSTTPLANSRVVSGRACLLYLFFEIG